MTYVSNNLSLVEQHRQHADLISERIAQFLASGGSIAQVPSLSGNPIPPKRSAKIDPETILKRRKPALIVAGKPPLRMKSSNGNWR